MFCFVDHPPHYWLPLPKNKMIFLALQLHCSSPNIRPFFDQSAFMLTSQNLKIESLFQSQLCSKFVDVTMRIHGLTWNYCSNQGYVLHHLFSPHREYKYNKMPCCKITSHNQQLYCSFAFVYLFHRCEATFYPSTFSSIRWLYLKVHMLPMKEKMQNVFLDVTLRL